jgi:putative DNA primase/helicase
VALRWSDVKGTKKECLALTVIFADVDFGEMGHKKANRWKTREEAQAAIEAFPIPPSIIVHTGGGFQVYWILKEPFEFKNGNYAQVEAIMKGVTIALGGDLGPQDVSHILRLPGTFNVKTATPRPVETIFCDSARVYTLDDFAHYADQPGNQDQSRQETQLQCGPQTTNIDELMVPGWVKGLIRSGDVSGYEDDRSKRDHAVIGALKRADCNLDTIEAIFQEHPIGDRFREERNGRRYLEYSFSKESAGSTRPAGTSPAPEDPKSGDQAPEFSKAELLNFARAGQVGDARLFIRLYRGKHCYDHAAGLWYEWGGHYWVEDEKDKVLMALDRIVDLYMKQSLRCAWNKAQATREDDTEETAKATAEEKVFLSKIPKLQQEKYRRDVLRFAAAGDDSLGITGREWDQATFLLPCANGIYNLKSGAFRPGQPGDYIKTVCPTEWKGYHEPAPEWDKFLDGIFDGDQERISYVHRLKGYSISGQRSERKLPIFTGIGWNGKGTLFETEKYVLGDLAGPVPAEILLEEGKHNQKSGGAPTPEIMDLRGKRLVWASETSEGKRLNAGKVKLLTGGDTLVGRGMYAKKMVRFAPTHTIFLMTNHKPKANPDDFALWGRISIVPFDLSFVDNPDPANLNERLRDKDLPEKLKKEASGILAWLVRGFDQYQKRGLDPPDRVMLATEEYRQDEDTVNKFIEECCLIDPGTQIQAGEFYQEYEKWCKDNGHQPIWGNIFGKRVGNQFKRGKNKKGYFYKGVNIRR